MEQDGQFDEQVPAQSIGAASLLPAAPQGSKTSAASPLLPQAVLDPCPTCGGSAIASSSAASTPPSYVYAIGEIDWLPTSESLENEIAQVLAIRNDLRGLPQLEAEKRLLLDSRYIVRQLCWVLKIERLQTYILQPRDPADFQLLVEALRTDESRLDIDVIIGVRGPIAPPEMCNGLALPIVLFDQLYYFDENALVSSIPKPAKAKAKAKEFEKGAASVLRAIQQMTDNHGATDEHRALNYLAVRSPRIYQIANEMFESGHWLTALDVAPSRLSGSRGRKVLDVIFSYINTTSRITKKYFVRVDVTGEYPFIVTPLQEYFDR